MILSPRRLLVAAGITATLASSAWLAAGRADANTATSAASERSQAVKYVIDPVHSAAIFGIEWQDMTPFYGQFTSFSGSVTWDGKDPKTFSCDVAIPVESVDSHAEGRDRHLKSPDFFNANEFPLMTFKSTGLADNGDGTWTLKGDLSMHGQTHPIEAKLTHLSVKQGQRGARCGLSTDITIKRSQWGVGPAEGLGDDVRLLISIQSASE